MLWYMSNRNIIKNFKINAYKINTKNKSFDLSYIIQLIRKYNINKTKCKCT